MEPSTDQPEHFRISDRRLLKSSFTSFLVIIFLGLFAFGIYYNLTSPARLSRILGSETVNSPTPTPSPTPLPAQI